uniref:SUMO-activating enzyme subunit 2 n=1 Tax=Tetraodon nigroviridis TaxID=99883 RepID=H3CA92_TETNG
MAQLVGSLRKELVDSLATCKVLVVGAGGIGCELLKNLVLTGFKNIEVIDLDTIDVSNLNRQFLFQKKHVGLSKAQVAKESALQFCPAANITAYHDSVMNPDYNVEFFRKFVLVMNALDNRAARNHVNRMCLAADIPLIESGTAGYLGQVTVIKKKLLQCYPCLWRPFAGQIAPQTLTNSSKSPKNIVFSVSYHCSQLFGEEDADQDVSPDMADPEAAWNPKDSAAESMASEKDGDIKRVNTKDWARSIRYEPVKLFNKFFKDDIMYLLTMDKLWKKRKAPVPLDWHHLENTSSPQDGSLGAGLKDQQVLSIWGQCQLFQHSVENLYSQLQEKGEGAELAWDKDDPPAMDFVTAAANLRMHIFSMNMKSRFDVKSMAGNIIPAIATTNAIIAGLIVLESLKILSGQIESCRTIFLNKCPNVRKKLLVPCVLDSPSANCYVCVSKPEVTVKLNVHKTTVLSLQDKILKERFGMVAPDVQIEDGKGTILISSEEGETEANNNKWLSDFGIRNGSRLQADDFLQDYTLLVNVLHTEELERDVEFEVIGEAPDKAPPPQANQEEVNNIANGNKASSNQQSTSAKEEDDVMIVDSDAEEQASSSSAATAAGATKRKHADADASETSAKRPRTQASAAPTDANDDDDVIELD